MKTIVNGNKKVLNLLGKQRVYADEYRLMRYVLQAECEDGVLLHNTITGQMVLLSSEEASFLDKVPLMHDVIKNSLIEDYYLVPVISRACNILCPAAFRRRFIFA